MGSGLKSSEPFSFSLTSDRAAAQKAIRDLLALKPGFGATARAEFDKWFQPELVEHLIDGLRKAGLDVV